MVGRQGHRPGPAPANSVGTAVLRQRNLSTVLGHLRAHSPLSRVEIAELTGLHRTTVSHLVTDLLEQRLVRETGTQPAEMAGRPRQGVALHGAHIGVLGLEINVDYIAAHGTDLAGNALVERRRPFDTMGSGEDKALRRLSSVAVEAAQALQKAGTTLAGVGVAIPALVDREHGVVTFAPNLGWHDVPLATHLSAALGIPPELLVVDNDANFSALAEYAVGVAAGTPHLVYLTGEVGIGGGFIVDGKLLRGVHGFAGEVGHLPLDPAGERCGCGRIGCWETKVGLAKLVATALPDQAYGQFTGPCPDPEDRVTDLARGLRAGDPLMLAAAAEVGRWLGWGGAILANILNPSVIVVGGYFASLAEWLLPHAQAELDRLSMAGEASRCRILASNLGFGAASRGAAHLIARGLIDHPHRIMHLES